MKKENRVDQTPISRMYCKPKNSDAAIIPPPALPDMIQNHLVPPGPTCPPPPHLQWQQLWGNSLPWGLMLCSVAVYEEETRPAAFSKEALGSCSCVPGLQASQDPLLLEPRQRAWPVTALCTGGEPDVNTIGNSVFHLGLVEHLSWRWF